MRFEVLGDTLHPSDDEAVAWLANAQERDAVELKAGTRTNPQNNSIHLYCQLLADALNDAGYDMRTFPFKDGLSVPWSKDTVKRVFWIPVQESQVGTEHTRQLTTKEVNVVYEALDRAMSQKVGVHVEFPSREPALGNRNA